MATKAKEEHLKEIERDEERECREFAGVRVDALIEQLAEARAERDAALAERDALKAANPSPAPFVGGVTEAMLDALERVTQAEVKSRAVIRVAFEDARAAIRAQKQQPPVDREAIRSIACLLSVSHGQPGFAKTLLRAIGYVPSDLQEPASAPQAEPETWQHGETGRTVEMAESPGPRWQKVKPPAPAEAKSAQLAKDIAHAINCLGMEGRSNTPDFVSGQFLAAVFDAFNEAIRKRALWRGEVEPLDTAQAAPPTVLCTPATPEDLTIKVEPPAPAEAEGPTHTERLIRFVMDAAALDLQPWISSVGEVHFQDHLTVTDTEAAAVRAALLGGTAEQGRLVKPPTDEDRWSDLDRAWAMNAKAHLQALADIFGHDEDVTFDQALEVMRRCLSLKPPETREEKLRSLVDLAWELGDECLIWDKEVHVSVALMNDAERTMLRAHLDAKRKAAESAKDGAK